MKRLSEENMSLLEQALNFWIKFSVNQWDCLNIGAAQIIVMNGLYCYFLLEFLYPNPQFVQIFLADGWCVFFQNSVSSTGDPILFINQVIFRLVMIFPCFLILLYDLVSRKLQCVLSRPIKLHIYLDLALPFHLLWGLTSNCWISAWILPGRVGTDAV